MELVLKKDLKLTPDVLQCCLKEISCYSTRWSAWRKAQILARVFTKCSSINYDWNFNGIAAIDVTSKSIRVNPAMMSNVLNSAFEFVVRHIEHFPFLVKDYYGDEVFDFEAYVEHFSCFLILHEVGHALYTPSVDQVRKTSAAIAKEKHIPFSFIFYCCNVVEDAFIQQRLQLDYPLKEYRDYFFLGTTIIQGPVSVDSFVKHLDEGTKLSIKEKLFYFILRAYNLGDVDVQSMFNDNQLIGWSKESLDLFDTATTIRDKDVRCDYTCNQLVPVLFDILHEVVKAKKDELYTDGNDSSLLDEDKLREVEYDEDDDEEKPQPSPSNPDDAFPNEDENDSTDGNPESEKPEDEDGDEKDCGGETEEGSEDEEDGSESSDSETDSDSESNEDSEEDTDNESEGSSDEMDSETDSSSNSESSAQSKKSQEKSLEDYAQELEDQFNKELEDASNELNESIDEGKERQCSDSITEQIEKNMSKYDVNDIVDALNGVEVHKQKSVADMKSMDDWETYRSSFDASSQSLYNFASTLFKSIYNFDVDEQSYLDNGEIDENIMTDFYTEKSLNIFSQKVELVETRKIKIIFMIDDSGSMCGSRRENCIMVVPPLIHAFEDNDIRCALYSFGSDCHLLKDFDDSAILLDNSKSNITKIMHDVNDSGSTNIVPALMSLAQREYPDKEDEVYVLFVFTDGGFDDTSTASNLFKYLREELKFNLFGVTIDQSYGVESLKYCLFQEDYENNDDVHNYTSEELVTKLPQDIYSTIVDKFILKH